MRELKFRAWDKNNKRYRYKHSFILSDTGKVIEYDNGERLYMPYIVEQYTGLKDRNGEEIYEGDVLGGDWLECYIAWCNKCKQFQMFTVFGCMACSGDVHWYEVVEDDGKLEVIGNIHENPELLEAENENN